MILKYSLSKAFPIGFRLEIATGPFDLMVKNGRKEILVGVDIVTDQEVLLIPANFSRHQQWGQKRSLTKHFLILVDLQGKSTSNSLNEVIQMFKDQLQIGIIPFSTSAVLVTVVAAILRKSSSN